MLDISMIGCANQRFANLQYGVYDVSFQSRNNYTGFSELIPCSLFSFAKNLSMVLSRANFMPFLKESHT